MCVIGRLCVCVCVCVARHSRLLIYYIRVNIVNMPVESESSDRPPVVNYSPSRSCRSLVLFLADNLLCAAVIGPLVVFYWRGTWELLNIYLFPDDQAASGWTCSVIGNVGLVCIVYLQKPLARWIRVDNPMQWMFGYHTYTYVLGGLNVLHWRGVWVLLDHYTGVNVLSSWITFAIGRFLTAGASSQCQA